MAFAPVRPRWRTLAEIVLVAGLYSASSRLVLGLVPGTGHATAVWPASGIMLAAVLLLGPQGWPGIALGAFAIGFEISLASAEGFSLLVASAISIAIALGAYAQTLVAAFSVRRLAGYPNTLANESDVLR